MSHRTTAISIRQIALTTEVMIHQVVKLVKRYFYSGITHEKALIWLGLSYFILLFSLIKPQRRKAF